MKRGFSLIEMLVAIGLLSFVAIALAQGITLSIRQRQQLHQRLVLNQAAANLAERVTMIPWADLSDERLAEIQLDAATLAVWPELKLALRITDDAGPPTGKRILISLQPAARHGTAPPPTELVVWRFATVAKTSASP